MFATRIANHDTQNFWWLQSMLMDGYSTEWMDGYSTGWMDGYSTGWMATRLDGWMATWLRDYSEDEWMDGLL